MQKLIQSKIQENNMHNNTINNKLKIGKEKKKSILNWIKEKQGRKWNDQRGLATCNSIFLNINYTTKKFIFGETQHKKN